MKYQHIIISILWISALSLGADAFAQSSQSIGNVTAVQRQVEVVHSGVSDVSVVNLGALVFLKDAYETKSRAGLKLLFEDDSILSLGENTKLQITENIYNPDQDRRNTVIEVLKGSVRALIGKIFGSRGSKFEIHTPTAAAAARGTYFIVWTSKEGGKNSSGVVNIGESGKVVVSNVNPAVKASVELDHNQYTLVEEGKPPTPASGINPGMLNALINSTDVQDQIIEEIPKGTEVPGSNVSEIVVTPFPSALTAESETGGGVVLPTVPPIAQQPMNGAPVSVIVNFP